jgi:heptaprenylglyceryl phosphate synthase
VDVVVVVQGYRASVGGEQQLQTTNVNARVNCALNASVPIVFTVCSYSAIYQYEDNILVLMMIIRREFSHCIL